MSESTYSLVFEGKITPGQDLAEVKKRLQKAFNKDAQTVEKLFSGKKIKLKQGLTENQAIQFKAKMQSIGAVCEVEAQAPKSSTSQSAATQSAFQSSGYKSSFTSSEPAEPRPNPEAEFSAPRATASLVGSPAVANVSPSIPQDSGRTLKLSEIDNAFDGMISRVELPATYKAGVIAMGVTMVLLPLLYVGLIAMIAYGVISHSVVHTTWMQTLGAKFGAIAYITPIIAGITVILFMIKPLFAKPAVKSQTVTLDPIKEPILFHFVNKIALAVGAPRPKQIDVDCEVNASASFRKGLFSFVGDDLVLTIGMPLLAGFNAKQLAGVLAHEFGHFSQGVGMRFHYLAYKINSWFFYSVHARDSWDEKLDEIANEAKDWASVIFNVARGGVWLTRKVLTVFMMAGQLVSRYMLRQMEFDADRYEAQLAGSQQFKNTTLQLQRLGAAYQISHDYLAQAWEDKKLVNDFPSLVAHNASQLPDELDRALLSQMEESRTHVYSSHPSDKDRIENAMQQQAKGIFSLDCHSRDLFKRFDSLSKQVSQVYYAHELGLEFDPAKLVDINQVVKIAQDNEKQQEAYHAYFKDMAPVFDMPLSVNIFDTSKNNWDDLLNQYKDAENQLADQISGRRSLMKKVEESHARFHCFSAIHDLDQAGVILFPEWFDISAETFEAHKKHLAMFEQTFRQSIEQLRPMFEVNDKRMSIALTLLNHPKVLDADPDHAQHLKIRNRFSLLINNIKRNAETIVEFRFKHSRLAAFLSCLPAIGQKPADLPTVRDQLLEDLKQSSQQLSAALNRLDYPFVAEGEHQTIAEYLEPFLPKANQFSSEHEFHIASGDLLLEKLDAIYGRIISGLAGVALTVDRLIPYIEGKIPKPVPAPQPQRVEEQVRMREEVEQQEVQEQQVEEQQVEYAKAVGTEDFAANKKQSIPASDNVASKPKPVQKPEAKPVQAVEKPVQPKAAESVAEKPEEIKAAEQVVEKPKFVVKEIKDAGKRSTFAIDMSEPAAEEAKSEEVNTDAVKAEEPAAEEVRVVAKDNKDAGIRSSFAIDMSEPGAEEPKAEEVKANEAEADESVAEEVKVVAKENKDAVTRSSFAIDMNEPRAEEPKTEEIKAEEPAAEEVKVVAKENKDAGTRSSFAIDMDEPRAEEPKVKEVNDEAVQISDKPAVEPQNVHGEPLAVKSSNPFMSRSAFSPKQEDDSPVVSSKEATDEHKAVEQPAPAVPRTPNPFLANISSYKAKFEAEKSGGASMTVDALNAGSLPAAKPSTVSVETQAGDKPAAEQVKPGSEKEDKFASFSTGGLSLEPLAGEETKSDSKQDSVSSKPDPKSVVVGKQDDAGASSHVEESEQTSAPKFFESPGLPNRSPAQERGLRPEPPADLFKAFGESEDAADDAGQDSLQADPKANEPESPNDRPSNH